MRFLGQILATVIGLFVFCMIGFFGLMIISAVFGSQEETVHVSANSILKLDLREVKLDYAGRVNFTDFDYFKAEHNGLFDVVKAIQQAKTDDDIKGISIVNPNTELGLAQIKTLHDALVDFKKSGKFVYAYADVMGQKEYYLCAPAHAIYLNPAGEMEFKGIGAELMFFKDLQDKSGVQMEVIRHGKYKSAVEPFLDNQMSDANREQMTVLLNSLWNSMVNDVARDRKIPVAQLNHIANTLGGRTPAMAKAAKLIDQVAYLDQYEDQLRRKSGLKADDDLAYVNIVDYAQKVATTHTDSESEEAIAVVYAQGEIMDGEGDVNIIGEGAMRRALQEAREDKDVKAVVLRVDSPGGNALTSELIWRELELTKKVKPLIVSMGNYAASGGYYISCNAHKIFAEKGTITGSIGVFGVFPNFAGLSNRIGIHTEQVKTHAQAAEYSPFLPVDPAFRAYAQEGVERVYTLFANRVAAGRHMTFAQVDAIGQGRVWSGADAKNIGLVDAIGGLQDAIKEAAQRAKISDYQVRNYPEYDKDFSDLFKSMGLPFAQSASDVVKTELGPEAQQLLTQYQLGLRRKGVQARLPFVLRWE